MEETTSEFDKEKLQERLAKLAGGTALVNVYNKVSALELVGDEETGKNIVLRALEEPVRQIAANAGLEGSVIVDPTKVTRSALQNATSVAAMFLTTEAVVADIHEKEAPGMPDMGGMGMM